MPVSIFCSVVDLPSAVRADEGDLLALIDGEGNAVDGGDVDSLWPRSKRRAMR